MGVALSLSRRGGNSERTNETEREDDEESEVQRFSSRAGDFFGAHFLMGGERYDVAKPEAFLFGDNSDLDQLGSKPSQFPYSRQAVTDPVRTLNALINLRRDSVKFVKISNDDSKGGESKDMYLLEFYLDCDSVCYVQIHFFAKEFISDGQVEIVSKNPHVNSSDRFYFDVGAEQLFDKFTFDPSKYDVDSMRYESGVYFPVVIELCTVECGITQVQTTMASVEKAVDQTNALVLKPLKQKLIVDGVVYLLQEIYGLENKEHDLTDENGSECIICMSDIRDTVILPCRHLCICNGCAETLRYKLNNCPICRSPFRALLQLKTMRVVSTVSITDQSSSTQQTRSQTRYETMTLVEALNGPVSHIQSCVIPPSPATPCDVDNSHSFPFVKETSEKGISLQQVKVLTANSVTDEGENPVYIEMDTTKITSDRPLSILVDETSSFGKPSLNRTTSSPSTMSHGSYALTVTEKDEVDEIQENHQLRSDDQDMKTEAVASESDHRSMSHTTVPRSSSMPTRVTVLNRKGARNMENSSEDR